MGFRASMGGNPRKTQGNTSKGNINRYPKLERNKEIPQVDLTADVPDPNPSSICFPYIKSDNCGRLLPNYSSVLGRTAKVGVFVEDLDQLQHDLEKLLSFAASRNRLLRGEVKASKYDKKEWHGKGAKKRKATGKVPNVGSEPTAKRVKLDDKRKLKYAGKPGRPANRFIKLKHHKNMIGTGNTLIDASIRQPRIFIPRNDMSEKFWTSIERYCLDINRDDTVFIDDLIRECRVPSQAVVPEIGVHYSTEWSDTSLSMERHFGGMLKDKYKPSQVPLPEFKKNGLVGSVMETGGSPLTQRLFDSLMEEKVLKEIPKINGSDSLTMNGSRVGVCLDHRLRRELVLDEVSKPPPMSEGVVDEIQRCKNEMYVLNMHNITELEKLREICTNDFKRQKVKTSLKKVDDQVLEMYGEIRKAKQTNVATFARLNLQPFEKQAQSISEQQIDLYRAYLELCDFASDDSTM